jgi:hypothetical protein
MPIMHALAEYSHYTDEELLLFVYQTTQLRNSLELELATRLVHVLDELAMPVPKLEDVLARAERKMEVMGSHVADP